MKDYLHLVVTRFNLKLDVWVHDKKGEVVDSSEWMEHRFMLFEKYCLPSLQNQSNQDFKWLVFFDQTSSRKDREKIFQLQQIYENLIPIFSTFESANDDINAFVDERIQYLITTRLDNDDIYRFDAIDRIQQQFNYQELEYINYPKGYRLNIIRNHDKKISLSKINLPCGPFVTAIEKKTATGFGTVWNKMHFELKSVGPYTQIDDARYWIQTVHQRNIKNDLSFRDLFLRNRISKEKLLQQFGIML